MKEPSKSPNRHTFQKEAYIKRKEEAGEEPSEDYLDMFEQIIEDAKKKWTTTESKKDNMEWDLVTTDWILEKVRASKSYAQNLYAAMCNNDFQKLDTMPILKNQKWHCSWRYAGGIVADMRQEGDYIDWYCSGIRNDGPDDPEDLSKLTEEQLKHKEIYDRYVGESVVTDEIRDDLKRLGWIVIDSNDLF